MMSLQLLLLFTDIFKTFATSSSTENSSKNQLSSIEYTSSSSNNLIQRGRLVPKCLEIDKPVILNKEQAEEIEADVDDGSKSLGSDTEDRADDNSDVQKKNEEWDQFIGKFRKTYSTNTISTCSTFDAICTHYYNIPENALVDRSKELSACQELWSTIAFEARPQCWELRISLPQIFIRARLAMARLLRTEERILDSTAVRKMCPLWLLPTTAISGSTIP